jgi:hypothetical protein
MIHELFEGNSRFLKPRINNARFCGLVKIVKSFSRKYAATGIGMLISTMHQDASSLRDTFNDESFSEFRRQMPVEGICSDRYTGNEGFIVSPWIFEGYY